MTKLSKEDKLMILQLWETGAWTQQTLADKFGVHKSRVNHIVNDTYGEHKNIGDSDGPQA